MDPFLGRIFLWKIVRIGDEFSLDELEYGGTTSDSFEVHSQTADFIPTIRLKPSIGAPKDYLFYSNKFLTRSSDDLNLA